MKMQPIKILPTKPRALLIYDADREIDIAHPLWNEIMLYGDQLEELHCIILVKNLAKGGTRVVNLSPNVFAYYMSGNHLWWHFDEIVDMIKYHMVWKREFRPHFILNLSTHTGGWIGYILAKRYGREFFVSTNGTFLEAPLLSREFIRQFALARCAQGIFVPGEKVADTIVTRAGVRPDKVTVVRPAVDTSFLGRKPDPINFGVQYPQQKFFLLTHASLGHRRDSMFVARVFAKIVIKYPRVALVVMVPTSQVRAFERILSTKHTQSIHVRAAGDDIANYVSGANIYLAAADSDEATIPIIQALSVHTPVVTTQSGIAKEIFTNTPYEKFMAADIEGFCKAISLLIENAQERDAYRLNSTVLVQSLSLQTLQGHVSTVLAKIMEGKQVNG